MGADRITSTSHARIRLSLSCTQSLAQESPPFAKYQTISRDFDYQKQSSQWYGSLSSPWMLKLTVLALHYLLLASINRAFHRVKSERASSGRCRSWLRFPKRRLRVTKKIRRRRRCRRRWSARAVPPVPPSSARSGRAARNGPAASRSCAERCRRRCSASRNRRRRPWSSSRAASPSVSGCVDGR